MLLPALPAGCARRCSSCCICRASGPACWSDIFTPKCRLPVREAEDKEPIEPGTVYFAPPDYHLLVDAGRSSRCPPTSRSISHDRRSTCCSSRPRTSMARGCSAIILTGASQDGALGLEAVAARRRRHDRAAARQRAGAADGGIGAEARPRRSGAVARRDRRRAARAGCAGLTRAMTRSPPRVKCLLVDDREENLLALSTLLQPRRRRRAARRAPAPRRWSCCSSTMSPWRCSTCRCRTWTASSWPS